MMLQKCFFPLFTLALALQCAVATAEIKIYSGAIEIRKYSDVKLSGELARGYSRWQKEKAYFGAIAINVEEDSYSFWTDLHSLDSVVSFVLEDCEDYAGKPCELYAVMVPKDFPKDTLKGGGLSSSATKDFKQYLSDHVDGKNSAFAINGVGGYGFAWEYSDKEEAVSAATFNCEGQISSMLAELDKGQRSLVKKLGMTTCKVIDVRK